ncbi:MAG: DNA polymerase III subunit alpha, partial [Bdellovibrionota bacterium]
IESGKNLDFERPKSLVPSEYYLKPAELMRERLERYPGAFENTQIIKDRCNLEFKFKDEMGRPIYHLPIYRPEGIAADTAFDTLAYFRDESRKGLGVRFAEPSFEVKVASAEWATLKKQYQARLEEELAMIERTGFSSYFCIVADFINWAKRQGIPVGPGRGSGAGSLVAFSLRITDIDPLEFNLLFERFINPERISMPDFDIDFCQDRRGEVIEYVSKKYGSENVSQIITFGKLQARAVIKDVGRVLGLTFAEADSITKLLPDELDITIDKAIAAEPRLQERMEREPKVAKLIQYARALEGLYRNAGTHAAGVIITEKPIVNYCPLFVGREGDVVTQFDKDFAEAIGLVKFDFLGLKTLTVIDHAIKLIRKTAELGTPEETFDIERINYSDPRVFALISSGDTDGVFQVESSGMKDLCVRLIPSTLEDVTAINALYRPGPLGSGMVDDFIDRKHARKAIEYPVESLAPILKDTYGVFLYQEQVMQTARELAGYSLGQADLLRRAMGKKKSDEMAEHRAIFVKGATEKGLP